MSAASAALPVNYRLDEYVIQNVLGQGGFGITYLARDARLGALVAIKEYFPQAYASRDRTQTIRPHNTDHRDVENYRWGLQEFLKEARALAKFKHANIVRVLRFLEANSTAYMVMEYEEGESLSAHLARHGGFLAEPALLSIFLPVLNGLQAVHDAGLLHLDIKPDNIYLRRNGMPMLIDFGAARQRKNEGRSDKVALTPGYAALEQYPGNGELGPWSDVYSMGATLYRCIVGREPVDAHQRRQGLQKLHLDPLVPATKFERPHYSPHIRASVDAAMTLKADDRPRSALALQNGLMGKEMREERKAVADNAYSRGAGFIGVVLAKTDSKRRRYVPRGPIERLLVFLVFVSVLVVASTRILVSTGHLSDSDVYDRLDGLVASVGSAGRQATRFVEETVFGIKRPPEYVAASASSVVVRAPVARPVPEKPVPVFDTAKQLAVTQPVPAAVMSLAFVSDGTQLALAFEDGSVELRALNANQPPKRLQAATGSAAAIAVSPDGKRLAFSAQDNVIRIWDVEHNAVHAELHGHIDVIRNLVFSNDGKWLASSARDQSAYLWEADSGKLLHDLSKSANEPLSLAFTPDDGILAVSDSAGGIRYWNLTAEPRDIAYVPTRDLPVTALAYSPDGKHFAIGGEQGFLSLWDVSGKRADRQLRGAPDMVYAVVFSPDSKWLIVAGSDSALQLWDVDRGQLVEQYAGANRQTFALALAPAGGQVAAAGIDGKLTLWR